MQQVWLRKPFGQGLFCKFRASPMSSASILYCTNTSSPLLLYTPSMVGSLELATGCQQDAFDIETGAM